PLLDLEYAEVSELQAVTLAQFNDNGVQETLDNLFDCHTFLTRGISDLIDKLFFGDCSHLNSEPVLKEFEAEFAPNARREIKKPAVINFGVAQIHYRTSMDYDNAIGTGQPSSCFCSKD
ncbi:MAG: hypothetical protein AAGC44_07490, partial [Planctomycetota bacterium]